MMRDSVGLFVKTLEDYSNSKNVQNNLLELVENLYKDLENERSVTANLQKQIQTLTQQDVCGVTSKFVALKEEYSALKNKLITLRSENDDLNIQLIAKSQEAKSGFEEKENELKNFYENMLKQKDEEISCKEQEIEANKIELQKKEEEFYKELQLAQASTAFELDQVESDLKKKLNECNKKFKDSIDTCNILRIELMSVKEQFATYKKTTSETIADLQKRIREISTSESSHLHEDVPWNDVHDVSISTDNSNKYKPYKPLNVSFKSISSLQENPINLKKVPVYRSYGKSGGSTLPPLVPLKNNNAAKESTTTIKKRKLYNPDDLAYLNADNE